MHKIIDKNKPFSLKKHEHKAISITCNLKQKKPPALTSIKKKNRQINVMALTDYKVFMNIKMNRIFSLVKRQLNKKKT